MNESGGSNQPNNLEQAAAYQVLRTSRILRIHLIRFLANQEIDLTPEQYFVFYKISRRPGASQAELADAVLGDHPNITRLVDSLVSRGAVERRRSPEDRRRHALYLTKNGQIMADRLIPAVVAERAKLIDGVDRDALKTFTEVLAILAKKAAELGGMLGENETNKV